EPWIEGRPFLKHPDYPYYADRVAQTLARVTEVFDWDAEALLGGSRQRKLGAVEGPRTPSRAGAPATLDTPVADLGTGPNKRRTKTRSLSEFP
ncbi:MAG: DNA polymerase II, partial [Thermoplasmata archaeon]|nr:DNA polymerase II [Thermoplasmata archaeon]